MLKFHPFIHEPRFINRLPALADQYRQLLKRIELRCLGVIVPRNLCNKLKGNAFLGELYSDLPGVRTRRGADQTIHG
jgi:hypothetical protein